MLLIFYTSFLLVLFNQPHEQMESEQSVWMFVGHDYNGFLFLADRVEFIKFIGADEIEYFNSQGELIDTITYQKNEVGDYLLSNGDYFTGLNKEYKGSELIYLVQDDYKLFFRKLKSTKTRVESIDLEELLQNSKWELTSGKTRKILSISEWENISEEKIKKIMNDAKALSSYPLTNHLIKIEDSIILIRQKLGLIISKTLVRDLSEDEMVVKDLFKKNREEKFIRLK